MRLLTVFSLVLALAFVQGSGQEGGSGNEGGHHDRPAHPDCPGKLWSSR